MKRSLALTRASALLVSTSFLCLTALSTASFASDLIIAAPADIEPANLDYQVDPYTPDILFDSFMTDPLIVVAPDGSLKPGLASEWSSSTDAREYTLKLKPGVTFQDGTPFNAAAVKYNFERILAPETKSALLANNIGPLKSVEVVDDLTVKFKYDAPRVNFLSIVTTVPIWSPTAAKASTPQDFDKKLVGTGPFKLVEWVPNDHFKMVKWDGYGGWNSVQAHKGAALVDTVTIKFIGEKSVLGSMVANGEADIGYQIPALSADQYRSSDQYGLQIKGQSGTGLSMTMNTAKPPLDNKDVRQALLYGHDMKAVNDLVYDGLYTAADGPLNNEHRCYWPGATTAYPYDPAKAKGLLDKAGWKDDGSGIRKAQGVKGVADGTPLTIRWTILHHQEIGEAVQAQLREIGVDLKIELVPGTIQLGRVQKRDFDLMYERLRSSDPQILNDIYNPSFDKPGGWFWSGFKDDQLTKLVTDVATNPDDGARCESAKQAQKIVMDNAVVFPTLNEPVFVAISSKVKGFKMGAEGTSFFLNDVSKE
jgi:peptide/nickel transport system substrate-binding protein